MKIFLILFFWIIIFILFLINYFQLIYIVNNEKKKIINKYRKQFDHFDLRKLRLRFKKKYDQLGPENYKKLDLILESFEYLERQLYLQLMDDYHLVIQNISFWKPNLKKFKLIIKKLKLSQFEYNLNYLMIHFELNEISLTSEIEDKILFQIKDLFGQVTTKIYYSKYQKMINKTNFRTHLSLVEKMIDELELILESDFKITEFKHQTINIVVFLQKIIYDLEILEEGFNYLSVDFPKYRLRFKKMLNENENAFKSFIKKWEAENNKIKKILFDLQKSLNNLAFKKVRYFKEEIDNKIQNLFSSMDLNSNIYNFLINYQLIFDPIIKMISEDKFLLDKEIKIYLFRDQIKYLEKNDLLFQKINLFYQKYLKFTNDGYRFSPPYKTFEVLKYFLDAVWNFLTFLSEIKDKINKTISESNKINQLLAKSNNFLLSIEENLKFVSEEQKINWEEEFCKHEKNVSILMKKHYNNYLELSVNSQKEFEKILKKLKHFDTEVKSYVYLFKYLEWLILILNRYSFDQNIANSIKKIKVKYQNNQFSEALKISNQIVEIYNLRE